MATASKELTTIEATPYLALRTDPLILKELLEDNGQRADDLTLFDLAAIKIPTGGGKFWTVPTADGEKPFDDIHAVVVGAQDGRAYWAGDSAPQKGTPPDCASADGVTGVGSPGGACRTCPFAQFGSKMRDGKRTRGQACKKTKTFLLLIGENQLPNPMTLPPTSLGPAKDFLLGLATQGLRYYEVEVSLKLEQRTSKGGDDYSRLQPKVLRKLTDYERDRAFAQRNLWRPLLQQAPAYEEDAGAYIEAE